MSAFGTDRTWRAPELTSVVDLEQTLADVRQAAPEVAIGYFQLVILTRYNGFVLSLGERQ
jgi:hypothetical protein